MAKIQAALHSKNTFIIGLHLQFSVNWTPCFKRNATSVKNGHPFKKQKGKICRMNTAPLDYYPHCAFRSCLLNVGWTFFAISHNELLLWGCPSCLHAANTRVVSWGGGGGGCKWPFGIAAWIAMSYKVHKLWKTWVLYCLFTSRLEIAAQVLGCLDVFMENSFFNWICQSYLPSVYYGAIII